MTFSFLFLLVLGLCFWVRMIGRNIYQIYIPCNLRCRFIPTNDGQCEIECVSSFDLNLVRDLDDWIFVLFSMQIFRMHIAGVFDEGMALIFLTVSAYICVPTVAYSLLHPYISLWN